MAERAGIDDLRWHEDAEPRACCRLKRLELLDAAHIIGDSEPEGIPAVRNGLMQVALCRIQFVSFRHPSRLLYRGEEGCVARKGWADAHPWTARVEQSEDHFADSCKIVAGSNFVGTAV